MARAKATVKQSDFSRAGIRPEFLESDADEIRQRSFKDGINVRPVARRGLARRHGTFLEATISGVPLSGGVWRIKPTAAKEFLLVFVSGGLRIYESNGTLDATFSSLPWTSAPWVAPAGRETYIGGDHEPYVLRFNGGSWSLGVMAFTSLPSGALAQPYYNFEPGVRINPSARTGAITLTASAAIFSAAYVGLRLRYHDKEIEITGYTSATQVSGTVIEKLPPSYDITVGNAEGFEVGEIVVGADSDWNGYVSAVDAATNVVKAVSLSGYEGPDAGEKLVGPNTKSTIAGKSLAASPYASSYWVEPVMSDVRGWPKGGAVVNGRLALVDFDEKPSIVCVSSVRALNDFETGLGDDDAIVRTIGEVGARVRHVVNAGDMLFFTDAGTFYVEARDNQEITPSNFAATRFDSRVAGDARPVFVDNAVIYASGADILAAILTGNVYLTWTVVVASDGYDGMFGTPVAFSAPPADTNNEARSLLSIGDDGNISAVFFNGVFDDAGLFHWTMAPVGSRLRGTDDCVVLGAAPMAATHWLVTERTMEDGGSTAYFLERMAADAYLDMATETVGGASLSLATPYDGATLTVLAGEKLVGIFDNVAAAEAAIAAYDAGVAMQVGMAPPVWVEPWPIELIESPRLGMLRARTIRVAVSVRNTTSFYVERNEHRSTVEAYSAGDDTSAKPPQKTGVYRFPVLGNRDHPEIRFGQDEPGPFEVLAYIAEVQA